MTATAVAAFVAGVTAAAAAADGHADPGVVMETPGGHVLAVSPTGFAWTSGVRQGQLVVSVTPAERGWELVTSDGSTTHTARAATAEQALRDAAPLALAALAFGGLSLVLRRTRRDWVVGTGSVAIYLASIPLWIQGSAQLSTAAMLAALLVPAGWLATRIPNGRSFRLAAAAGLGIYAVVWTTARLGGAPSYSDLEVARGFGAFAATGAVIVAQALRPILADRPVNIARPSFVDLTVVGAIAVLSVSLMAADIIPPLVLGLALVLALVAVPAARNRFGRGIEEAVLGDVRNHARAEGADEERARLARELHDDHLQELVGVIRQLEVKPGTEAEREELRSLAARLRTVASDLRPPVLDDFGLPAALEYLAEHSTSDDCPVVNSVEASPDLDWQHRPPQDVELAMYRIAGEAVGNALRHAHASRVEVHSSVSPEAIVLEVADDGLGVTSDVLRDAVERNRMGVASMRRRAAAIDADFAISSAAPGTLVRAEWRR